MCSIILIHKDKTRFLGESSNLPLIPPLSGRLGMRYTFPGIASAESSDSATGRVVVEVISIVSISVLTEIVNAGTVQTGDFSATLTFSPGPD